ncbi:hypothetical protein SDC9_120789 [bioreactor metagenome]|uniref:Uncharacterized protein n=1 Tax=bioreactor metagenome TaxID=1076179 RepID=A0A645CA50_9ZZZZ
MPKDVAPTNVKKTFKAPAGITAVPIINMAKIKKILAVIIIVLA